ncbi:MAG: MarR family transcriptional regulator [Armatimonadota bacterium]
MLNIPNDKNEIAIRLVLAVKRLKSRLREESHADSTGLSISQLCILHRLNRNGPATAASLATAEHVSQQAIAQILTILKSAGLVQADADPNDGRKTLISITDAGLRLRESMIASRNAWLVRAIDSTIDAEELGSLDKAIELLERLADADR